MNLRVLLWLAIALSVPHPALTTETAAPETERYWLRYRHDAGFALHHSRSYRGLQNTTPSGAKLPTFTSTDPQFFRWEPVPAGTNGILVALDRSRKRGPYDRLYIDANGDGNLSDETPQKPDSFSQLTSKFGNAKVVFATGDGPVTYHVSINTSLRGNKLDAAIGTACWYEGTVRLAGESRNIRVIDHSANGVFNEALTSKGRATVDRIAIQDGSGYAEYPLAMMHRVDDSYYRVSVARDGSWIDLTREPNVKLGSLRLADEVEELQVSGESGSFEFKSTNRVHRIPAGTYTSQRWVVRRIDERGTPWRLEAHRNPLPLEVVAGQETEVMPQPPLECRLRVQTRGRNLHVRTTVWSGGSISMRRGRQPAPGPTLVVRSKDGSFEREHRDRSASFRRGVFNVPIPPEAAGGYIITARYPGPFDVIVEPYEVGPVLQVATHPASTNAIKILWEINGVIPYDGKRYRTCTGAFLGSNQVDRLEGMRFHVLRGDDGRDFEPVGEVTGPENQYLDAPVPGSTLFYYKVVAVRNDGTEWGESAVTMGAAGANKVEHASFESFTNGVFRVNIDPPDGFHIDNTVFAIQDGSRPYTDGRKVLAFDPAWLGARNANFKSSYIRLATNEVYLTGAWVFGSGNVWYGRFFQDQDKEPYAYSYSMAAVNNAPHWTFGAQIVIPDVNWEGEERKDNRWVGMAKKNWTYPSDASFTRAFLVGFGEGKLDDHWMIKITNAPQGSVLFNE